MIISQSVLENRMVSLMEAEIINYRDILSDCVSMYNNGQIKDAVAYADDVKKFCFTYNKGVYKMACNIGCDQRGLEELKKRHTEANEEINTLYGRFIEWTRASNRKGVKNA